MPIRRFDDNVYSRLKFLKAVSHSMAALAATSIPTPRIRTATHLMPTNRQHEWCQCHGRHLYFSLWRVWDLYVKHMFAAFDCVQRCLSCFNLWCRL